MTTQEMQDQLEQIRQAAWEQSLRFSPGTDTYRTSIYLYDTLTSIRDSDVSMFQQAVKKASQGLRQFGLSAVAYWVRTTR